MRKWLSKWRYLLFSLLLGGGLLVVWGVKREFFRQEVLNETPRFQEVERTTVTLNDLTYAGFSSLAFSPETLKWWTAPERQRVLLGISAPKLLAHYQAAKAGKQSALALADMEIYPVVGLAPKYDVEALAVLEPDTWALGTETPEKERAIDQIFIARLTPEPTSGQKYVKIERALTFDYALWQLKARRNMGLEGLCKAGNYLVAASETTGELAGRKGRFAPLGIYDLRSTTWTPYRLWLTSETGKISALTCLLEPAADQAVPTKLRIWAIERHFQVARILSLSIILTATTPVDIYPRVDSDLAAIIPPKELKNYEGLSLSPDGQHFILLNDNHFWRVMGATEFLFLTPRMGSIISTQ